MALRVFLSHTEEFASYRADGSFVDVAIEAVTKAGHAPVDVRWFAPADWRCRAPVRRWCRRTRPV
ncbi:hypothetical protein [Cryptosporangium sp. NPDC051539]|uniref:hypothetical protein n=1 Tax=Cryptosporangium sp. NPDC051539 TaxID=3363962 RepID=UPI0037903F46